MLSYEILEKLEILEYMKYLTHVFGTEMIFINPKSSKCVFYFNM